MERYYTIVYYQRDHLPFFKLLQNNFLDSKMLKLREATRDGVSDKSLEMFWNTCARTRFQAADA